MRRRVILVGCVAFVVGLIVGGYLFVDSRPRSFLAVKGCDSSCYRPSDLVGLLASAGIQRAPDFIPRVVKETDQCLAITHPLDRKRYHVVIFPKKDIKNIGDVAVDDQPYIMDCLAVIRALVVENGLRKYQVYTNGPGAQDVTYLHFHLAADRQSAERPVGAEAAQDDAEDAP